MKSIDPAIWGPSGWKIVHTLAAYAAKDPSVMKVFPHFFVLLPCPACQHNYQTHLRELPLPTDPRKMLRWSYDLHQRVNGWKGKTVHLPFDKMQKTWRSSTHTLTWSDVWIFLEALLYSHAGATHISKETLDELVLFFGALKKVLPMRAVAVDELMYKTKFRDLLREFKKRYDVHVVVPPFSCSSEVCRMP